MQGQNCPLCIVPGISLLADSSMFVCTDPITVVIRGSFMLFEYGELLLTFHVKATRTTAYSSNMSKDNS